MTPFDATGRFRIATEDATNLRRRAVRGAGATVSASGVNLLVQVISTVMLARLLTPVDFGVVTMVSTFSLLLVSLGSNGFTEAVIQCDEIDHHTASNLFWLNVGAGLLVAIAFAVSGPLQARFYRNALVTDVAAVVSVQILIAAASVIHLALLKRAMRFTAASANEVVARTAYSAVALLLAWKGWGYWALVAGLVGYALSTTIGAFWLCRWVPSLPRRTGRTGRLVRFAANVYMRFGVGYFRQNIDNLLVGWRFNAASLGFYKKAYDLFALSATQLTAPLHHVALAALSRLNHDPVRFKRTLANSLGVIAFLGMAVGADLTLVGKDVVYLVLGPRWDEASRIFMFFGPGIGIMLLNSTVGWIHLSIGRPDRWLRWTILEFVVTAALFVAALPWGPGAVAVAWSVSFWTLFIPGFWYAGRPIGFDVSSVIAATWRYAAASLAAGLTTAAAISGTPFRGTPSGAIGALAATIVTSGVFLALYLGAVIVLHRGVGPLRQIVTLLRELAPARGSARPIAEPVGEYR
jgi:PST family polysaccharide transporter